MKIALITPVPAQSRQGNRVTALRWARMLKALGHQVRLTQRYDNKPYDLMVALHARRSFAAIERFRKVLKDPKIDANERKDALYFLVHFIGDMHQPMHCGSRGDDKGTLG